MPLTEVEPPSVLPRGQNIGWPLRTAGSDLASKHQSYFLLNMKKPKAPGVWMSSKLSFGPASSRQTLTAGSRDRRLASTQPAAPAPTMM